MAHADDQNDGAFMRNRVLQAASQRTSRSTAFAQGHTDARDPEFDRMMDQERDIKSETRRKEWNE